MNLEEGDLERCLLLALARFGEAFLDVRQGVLEPAANDPNAATSYGQLLRASRCVRNVITFHPQQLQDRLERRDSEKVRAEGEEHAARESQRKEFDVGALPAFIRP